MGFCGECGFKYDNAGRFCPECGNQLPQDDLVQVAEPDIPAEEEQFIVQPESEPARPEPVPSQPVLVPAQLEPTRAPQQNNLVSPAAIVSPKAEQKVDQKVVLVRKTGPSSKVSQQGEDEKALKAKITKICGPDAENGVWIALGVNPKGEFYIAGTGTSVPELCEFCPSDEAYFILLTLRLTMQGIANQNRNIFMSWKGTATTHLLQLCMYKYRAGPASTGMKKMKTQQAFQKALKVLAPNHGQLEIIGKTNFNQETIAYKWLPESGSHTID